MAHSSGALGSEDIKQLLIKQAVPASIGILFMSINIYVIFSWWNWWYGGGMSCRPLVESMAVLSLPLAAFTEQVSLAKQKVIKIFAGVLLPALIVLNMFQCYQTYKNVLHWDRTSPTYYFRVFFKSNATEEDMQYLMPEKEIYGEMEHRMEALEAKKK